MQLFSLDATIDIQNKPFIFTGFTQDSVKSVHLLLTTEDLDNQGTPNARIITQIICHMNIKNRRRTGPLMSFEKNKVMTNATICL